MAIGDQRDGDGAADAEQHERGAEYQQHNQEHEARMVHLAAGGDEEHGEHRSGRAKRVEQAETFGADVEDVPRYAGQQRLVRKANHLDRGGEHDEQREPAVVADFADELAHSLQHGRPSDRRRLPAGVRPQQYEGRQPGAPPPVPGRPRPRPLR